MYSQDTYTAKYNKFKCFIAVHKLFIISTSTELEREWLAKGKNSGAPREIESKTHSKKGVVRLKSVVNKRQITVQTIGLITELKSKFSLQLIF